MFDIDKIQTAVSWIGGLGIFVGTAIAAVLGIRRSRSRPDDDTAAERVRALQAQVTENRINEGFAQTIEAARQSFRDEIAMMTKSFREEIQRLESAHQRDNGDLENALHKIELKITSLEARRGQR